MSLADFEVRALSPEDVAHFERLRANGFISCAGGSPRNRCPDAILYEISYTYGFTNRGGGSTSRRLARRQMCQRHALRFTEKNKLDLPVPNQAKEPNKKEGDPVKGPGA